MPKIRFSITLDKDLVEKIDKIRNKIPRSTFINEILKKRMKGGKQK